MDERTIAIGDIHGDLAQLRTLWERLPELTASDTVVFLGDYVDRGPESRGVIEFIRSLPERTPARVRALMGNHEQILLDAYEGGNTEPLWPPSNGVMATYLSFTGAHLRRGIITQVLIRQDERWLIAALQNTDVEALQRDS